MLQVVQRECVATATSNRGKVRMKISELPHRDPAWAYIELNDGSLVAMPKKATEELQDETERLKKELERVEANNELQGKSLEAHSERITKFRKENERLKAEKEELKDSCSYQVYGDMCKEREKLLKENAKLRCLALHAMSQYYGYKSLFSSRKKTHRIKYGQFSNKFYEAYRKAKKELKEYE